MPWFTPIHTDLRPMLGPQQTIDDVFWRFLVSGIRMSSCISEASKRSSPQGFEPQTARPSRVPWPNECSKCC